MKLIFDHLSCLKDQPVHSSMCDEVVWLKKGTELELVNSFVVDGMTHVFVSLAEAPAESNQKRWWVYAPHVLVEGTEPTNNPVEVAPAVVIPEVTVKLPGISHEVKGSDAIYHGSKFTWGEATKKLTRIPSSAAITARIVKVARVMDEVRSLLGDKPIRVESWYRDPVSNREVGGAIYSRHMQGDAVDFWAEHIDTVDIFYLLKEKHSYLGGLAVGNGFVHIDLRPGGKSRWLYPNGPNVSLW